MDILSIFLGLLLLIGAVAFAVFAVWFAIQFLPGMWNVGRDKPQARPGQGASTQGPSDQFVAGDRSDEIDGMNEGDFRRYL